MMEMNKIDQRFKVVEEFLSKIESDGLRVVDGNGSPQAKKGLLFTFFGIDEEKLEAEYAKIAEDMLAALATPDPAQAEKDTREER